ncbi:hypothetical protein SAMN06269301_0265 [Geobacter sp. DSM 9736]|nr:hypothetical protein SAMN06269301_0265 [Geobacter sp. DSM 9736]
MPGHFRYTVYKILLTYITVQNENQYNLKKKLLTIKDYQILI